VQWFLYGLRHVFPEAWRKFAGMLPANERKDLLVAYMKRLFNPDPQVHLPFARAWSEYEATCSTLLPNPELSRHYADEALGLARLEAHYFANDCFLTRDQLLNQLHRVRHLPAAIVQGRYDMICPIASADELARAWSGARYTVVPDGGHSVWEPPLRAAVIREVEHFKRVLA
jgi:proline iminopeptidase